MRIQESLKEVSFGEVQSWIRDREIPFLNALTDLGDFLQLGRQFFGKPKQERLFTGSGLCVDASIALGQAFMRSFGNPFCLVESYVCAPKQVNKYGEYFDEARADLIAHTWLRFWVGDKVYFIDPTYGQVNRKLNRVVLDTWEREADYYKYSRMPEDYTTEALQKYDSFMRKLHHGATRSKGDRDELEKMISLAKSLD